MLLNKLSDNALCNLVFKFNLNDSMNSGKRLFLLDAYALIFRGYYAFIKNPRINSKGMDTSAIMGFTNSLLDVIKRKTRLPCCMF